MDDDSEAFMSLAEAIQEETSVIVVVEYGLFPVPSRGDMIERPWEFDPGSPGHVDFLISPSQ